MKKFIISILACLPMLGFAEYSVEQIPNNLTFVNDTTIGTNIRILHTACLNVSNYQGRMELGPGQARSVPITTIIVSGDDHTLCGSNSIKRILLSTGHQDYFSIDTGNRTHDLFYNLRELKPNHFSFSYQREGVRNVIYLRDIER